MRIREWLQALFERHRIPQIPNYISDSDGDNGDDDSDSEEEKKPAPRNPVAEEEKQPAPENPVPDTQSGAYIGSLMGKYAACLFAEQIKHESS